MTAVADPVDRLVPLPDPKGPSIIETYWGYMLREDRDRFEQESISEAAMRFLGFVLLTTAPVLWLLPASLFAADVFIVKTGLSLIVGVTGGVLYLYANRGLSTEVHVDNMRRELRVLYRNSRGRTRLQAVVPMRRVDGAFTRPPDVPGGAAQLFAWVGGRMDVLNIAIGPEHQIAALEQRLTADLRPIAERLDLRLASDIPFRSQRAA